MAGPSINNLNLNNLMHGVQYRNSLLTATKTPILDRYHYSEHGGDGQSEWAESVYGQSSHGSSGHKKSNIALSALTLLAFLFFLNILQNCIQDHLHDMNSTNSTGVVVMTTAAARRRFNRFNRHRVVRRSTINNNSASMAAQQGMVNLDYSAIESVLGNSELLESVEVFNATVGSSSNVERFYELLGKSLKKKYGWLDNGTMGDFGVESGDAVDDFDAVAVIEGGLKGDMGEFSTIATVAGDESTIERNFVPDK